MSHQDRREPLPAGYHFPVHSCGCPSCVTRLTPEQPALDRAFELREARRLAHVHSRRFSNALLGVEVCECGAFRSEHGDPKWCDLGAMTVPEPVS